MNEILKRSYVWFLDEHKTDIAYFSHPHKNGSIRYLLFKSHKGTDVFLSLSDEYFRFLNITEPTEKEFLLTLHLTELFSKQDS